MRLNCSMTCVLVILFVHAVVQSKDCALYQVMSKNTIRPIARGNFWVCTSGKCCSARVARLLSHKNGVHLRNTTPSS